MDERWQKGEFWLYAPYVLAHELCHYLAARLLGIPAHLHWRQAYTWLDSRAAPPRLMLALLAPALAGMASLLVWAGASIIWRSPFFFLLALGFHLVWWLMCLNDFYLVWFYLQRGRWPVNLETITTPLTARRWWPAIRSRR